MSVRRQPVFCSAASTGAASGASMAAVAPLCRIVHEHAEIVLQAGEQVGLRGHGFFLDSGRVRVPVNQSGIRTVSRNSGRVNPVRAASAPRHKANRAILPPWTSSICAISTPSGSARWRAASSAAASARAGRDTTSLRVVGIGYATPYLGLFREEAERCLALMPAPQGVVRWPSAGRRWRRLVEEDELPLTDSAVDRVLLVHALENSTRPGRACCAKSGACSPAAAGLLAVVPNRRGLWARMDTTPFGHGRPYSRPQITHLLRETWFTPTGWGEALYVPPISRGWFLRSAVAWERTGATLSAPFAGVHIVEATKQVYRAIPARRERRRLVPALQPVLAPSPGAAALR